MHNPLRILLKISGEILGNRQVPWTAEKLTKVAKIIKLLQKNKIETAVVMGGGNVWRYRDNTSLPIDRKPSDFLGMLATVYNVNTLAAALEKENVKTKTLSKIQIPKELGEKYTITNAKKYLKQGKTLLLAGGTGKSGFTTDTGAAIFASEISADEVWKATKVDGIYSSDPQKYKSAKLFKKITYKDYLTKKLGVMDQEAIEHCQKTKTPVRVFRFNQDNFKNLSKNLPTGSLISD